MTGSRPVRALRTGWRAARIAAFGGASLLLATTAHTAGGGSLPPAGVLIVAAIALGLIALPLTSRAVRWRVLVPLLAVEQAGLHALFGAGTAAPGCLPSGAHTHAVLAACVTGQSAVESTPAWAMWLGHALAVLATAWLLARGERWLWHIADRLVRAAASRPSSLAFPAPASASVVVTPTRRRPYAPLPPRGPPA